MNKILCDLLYIRKVFSPDGHKLIGSNSYEIFPADKLAS